MAVATSVIAGCTGLESKETAASAQQAADGDRPTSRSLAEPARVAVTIDDLPWSGPAGSATRVAGNRAIIHALQERGVPATGFVNCANVRGDSAILGLWRKAGLELGNHTARHLGLDQVGTTTWLADARECDSALRAILGHAPRHFRYPMLRQGATTARRDSAASALAGMGYRNAQVTIDNSEYLVAQRYRLALEARDSTAAALIASLYIDHLRATFRHARAVARKKTGREIAHVLLLHVNQLNADHLGPALDSLASDGARFVSLDAALSDSVFDRPDLYTGPRGLSWLYRIAPLDAEDVTWDDREAHRIDSASTALLNRRRGSGRSSVRPHSQRQSAPMPSPPGSPRTP